MLKGERMNYIVLTDKGMFNTHVAVFDSIDLIVLGILVKHGVINKLCSTYKKDNENFKIVILKIRNKHMDKFIEAMNDLDNINRTLHGQEYIDFCGKMSKMLHYELYKNENN